MVLPIGEPEADAIAVASEECERREPVCQPPWKLTQLSSASTAGLQQATNQRLHSAAAALRERSALPQRQKLFRVKARDVEDIKLPYFCKKKT